MKLQIKVDDKIGRITDACLKTFGCGSAIASSSLATEWVKGRTMEEVLSIKNTEIAKHLFLPPQKIHCSMLAEDAIRAYIINDVFLCTSSMMKQNGAYISNTANIFF